MIHKVKQQPAPDGERLDFDGWQFQYQLSPVKNKPRQVKATCDIRAGALASTTSQIKIFIDRPGASAENQAYSWVSKLKSEFLWGHNDRRLADAENP